MRKTIFPGVVFLSVLVLAGCQAPTSLPAGTPAITRVPTTPSPTAGVTSPPSSGAVVLTSLQMINATTGWATGTQGQAWRVWHTTSGGARWRDVTPPSAAALDFDTAAFMTASVAWIALRQSQGHLVLFRTIDGGQTWQQGGVIPSPSAVQMTFSTAQHGWVLANVGGNIEHETADLFQTTDGGTTWAKVASTQPQTAPGTLPADGLKGGLGFLTASTGWLTGAPPGFDTGWLWVTHDGGRTWQAQTLALPWLDLSTIQEVSLQTTPPRFFTTQEGVLSVLAFDANTQSRFLVVYRTQDGGATWQSTTPVQATTASFSDRAHGWATDGAKLWGTRDGGAHWTTLPVSTEFLQVEHLDAVSRSLGWALRTPSSAGGCLLQTTDGGQTWVVVPLVEGS